MRFARIDQSPMARWWWTVDRWSLAALAALMGFGVVMSLSASPAVAERIGYDGLHFVRRYLALLPVTIAVMFVVSLQTPRTVRRIAFIGFGISLVLLALTFVVGAEIKGARRWINFPAGVAAAFRIRQAVLRRRRGLAVLGAKTAPGISRQPDLRGTFAADRRDADRPARYRHGVLSWPRCGSGNSTWPGCGSTGSALFGLGGVGGIGRRLYLAAACHNPGRPLPRSRRRRRQLSGQPLARSLRQWRVVGPRPRRGHGQGRTCPMRMPISFSPSPARSSA